MQENETTQQDEGKKTRVIYMDGLPPSWVIRYEQDNIVVYVKGKAI